MLARMLQRRGTAAQWEDVKNTVILAAGEIGLETDTGKFKVGDGVTVWNDLSYYLRDSDNDDIYSKLVATQTFTGTQTLSPANASSIPLEVRGVDAQSAKLQRWRVGIGAPVEVASIDAAGKITATGGVFNDDVSLAGNLITNVATPITGTDAANKQYVDDVAAGISWKDPVNLVSASGLNTYINVALTGNTGTLVLDGHAALDSGDSGYRILLIGQTTASENGIYVYNDNGTTYTLTRSTDADSFQELDGASVFVSEGTNYGTSSWVQTNHYLDSFSGQTWVQFNGASQIVADGGLTKVGNTLAVGAGDGIQVNPDSVQIAAGGVTSGMIANGAIVNEDISDTAAIAATKISGTAVTQADTGTVSTTMIANDAVTNDKLADNAVGIENMKDDSVGTAELVDGAVTSAKIFNGTIVNDDISDTAAIAQSKVANLVTDLSNKSDVSHTHTLDNLSDVTITAPPVDRQVLKYKGAPINSWVNEVPSGGISVGDTPPVGAAEGDAWFDSTDGSLYVYYDDDSGSPDSQWVQVKANSALEASILTRLSAVETRLPKLEAANAIRVADMAARDAAFPSPVQGNTVFRTDLGYEQKYYAAYNATTNPDGTKGTPGWYEYRGGAPLSKNYLLNGDMEVNQRGLTSTPIQRQGTNPLHFGADRWKPYDDYESRYSITSISDTSVPARFATRLNSTTTSYAYPSELSIGQKIESIDTIPLRGKTITLSFYIRFSNATFTSSIGGNPYNNFRYELGYYTSTTNSSFILAGGSNTPNSYTFDTITNGSLPTTWTRVFLTGTVPTNANNIHAGLKFEGAGFTAAFDTLWYEVTGIQIEEGPVPTPFRRNQENIQAELAACQRYYQRYIDPPLRGVMGGTAPSVDMNRMAMTLNTEMRIAPEAYISGTLNVYDGSSTSTVNMTTGITVLYSQPDSVEMDIKSVANLNNGRPAILYKGGGGYLELSAEL